MCVNFGLQIKETPYTRLCSTKKILTVNGQFPGPALHVHKGDTIFVDVHNQGNFNITIHWYHSDLCTFVMTEEIEIYKELLINYALYMIILIYNFIGME